MNKHGDAGIGQEAQSVMLHLQLMQDVIARIASNGAACKTWCMTLVSATLALAAQTGKMELAMLALLQAVGFGLLDGYCLAQERGFRDAYNRFVRKLHDGQLETGDLYCIKLEGKIGSLMLKAMKSPSIWGFYLMLVVMAICVLMWGHTTAAASRGATPASK